MVLVRARYAAVLAFLVLLAFLLWRVYHGKSASAPEATAPIKSVPASISQSRSSTLPDSSPTNIYAHNLMLRKGPSFRVYVRWLRGQMARSRRNVNPSFDDPDSFALEIKTGVLRANIGDISNYLNSGGLGDAPLTNVVLSGDGDQIKLKGTVHKVVSLPVELNGIIGVAPGNRIKVHVTKINVLKIPFKGLLGTFHVTVSDFFKTKDLPGIEVKENDIVFDTQAFLPPPHIRGQLTRVHVVNPDLEEIYGDAQEDVTRTEQWRNFLRLSGGTIDFGKLTMKHVDLIMIDISKDPWFDLDLANYQEQLVNGYTRMTPQAGLQIFMPDRRDIKHGKTDQNIGIEWFKNRNLPPPADVVKNGS